MASRRYVVFGVGAVGGAIAALLRLAGAEVICIARGAQLAALAAGPLRLATPARSETVRLDVVAAPHDVGFGSDDVVLLCTKSQDASTALGALRAAAPASTPVICAQNGVAAERMAAAAFDRVYGMLVFVPATFLEPGRVTVHSSPVVGALDVGVHPRGTDELVSEIVGDLRRAGFEANAEAEILRLKYGKLLTNLGNTAQALAGRGVRTLVRSVQDEAIACYRAAGIAYAPLEEMEARYGMVNELPVGGAKRAGGSTWQSLARGAGSLETEYLNGEIVRLGAAVGIETPRNRALVALAERAVAERWGPGHMSVEELERAFEGPTR